MKNYEDNLSFEIVITKLARTTDNPIYDVRLFLTDGTFFKIGNNEITIFPESNINKEIARKVYETIFSFLEEASKNK